MILAGAVGQDSLSKTLARARLRRAALCQPGDLRTTEVVWCTVVIPSASVPAKPTGNTAEYRLGARAGLNTSKATSFPSSPYDDDDDDDDADDAAADDDDDDV